MKAIRLVFAVAAVSLMLLASAFTAGAAPAMVSLTFDDGLDGTYDFAFPILKKHGVPGVSGIVTSRIDPAHQEFMDWEQIDKMEEAGWEIASHSVNHVRPIDVPVFKSLEPITDWKQFGSAPAIYHAQYNGVILTGLFENNSRPLKEVTDVKELKTTPGSYFFDRFIQTVQVRPFEQPEYPSQLDIRAFSYEREMEQSKKDLHEHGINVKTYIPPYNYWTDEAKTLSKGLYQNALTGEGVGNRPANFDRFALKRYMVHTNDSVASLIRIVKDNAVDKNSWVIFCMHSIGDNYGWEPWDTDKLDKFVTWLKQEGIDVVTISEGVERMRKTAPGK